MSPRRNFLTRTLLAFSGVLFVLGQTAAAARACLPDPATKPVSAESRIVPCDSLSGHADELCKVHCDGQDTVAAKPLPQPDDGPAQPALIEPHPQFTAGSAEIRRAFNVTRAAAPPSFLLFLRFLN